MVYEQKEEKTPTTGILGTVFGGTALAGMLGILGGNGGGILGNNNPTASPLYQLAQKDTVIAKLESERYADALNREQAIEISNLKQRLAAIEVAEPLREQVINERVNGVQATIMRLVQPMIPNINVAYPPPLPTYAVNAQSGTAVTPTSTTAG